MCWVPLPWCMSQSRMATLFAPAFWAARAAIAALLKKQKPIAILLSAWWPGGLTIAAPWLTCFLTAQHRMRNNTSAFVRCATFNITPAQWQCIRVRFIRLVCLVFKQCGIQRAGAELFCGGILKGGEYTDVLLAVRRTNKQCIDTCHYAKLLGPFALG